MPGFHIEYMPLFFPLLFFTALAIYMFFGIHVFYMNPKASLNRLFFAVCISLSFWSLGFSFATTAPDLETCLLWRRISAIGWGSIYSLFLHYLLLLTGANFSYKGYRLWPLLYLPAGVTIFVFAISGNLAAAQYNLVMMNYGWINVSSLSAWDIFFYIYYAGYVSASLGIIWWWRQKTSGHSIRKQADVLFISLVAALLLGSLTDVILSATLQGPLPQMAPIFTLLPVGAIYYSMKHFDLMKPVSNGEELILDAKTLSKLYNYLSFAFLAGGFIATLAYFLPHLTLGAESVESMLYAGVLFFVMGAIIFLALFIKNEKIKEFIILTVLLCSIPLITLQFIEHASITIWAFPMVLIFFSLVFYTQTTLILLTVVAVITQLVVWFYAPRDMVQMDELDHIFRAGIFIIVFFAGSYVNRTYTKRLKDNIFQFNFQKLVSEISYDFVSVDQLNLDEKINAMLVKSGRFFQADRIYIFLIDHRQNTMAHTHEWCNEGIASGANAVQAVPLDVLPWWMGQLEANKPVCIENVNNLPEEAGAEKKILTQLGVKSALAVPIEGNEIMLGFIGLDSVVSLKKSSEHHVELLKILSNLLSDALIKINSEKTIEYMAYYDQLTDLPNRTLFSERLTKAIHLASRNKRFTGVIFVDLDSFKMVNDTVGHSGGDAIINEVAKGLTRRLRKTDLVARFGGDEFIIMVNELADRKDVIMVADDIMEMFRRPFYVHGWEFFITGSAGVAVFPFDGEDAETLVKNAEIAMYIAKSKGRNQYALCNEEMKKNIEKNVKLSNHLYRAEERGELAIHYQPQIELSTGRIIGLEALLRWNHPEMGMIPPNVFIPLAEMNGTINSIGEWVLKTAARQNKKWQDMGFPPLRMAVNLSVVQFKNPGFVNIVDLALKEAGLEPRYLELEITESVATKESMYIMKTLDKFKQLGVFISIDDFGTEYSSFNRLKTLPIDRIKIDMFFVRGIDSDEKDRAITNVIINLAKSLGLEVLAEGVETASQLEFLKQKMCDAVQGYYYYKPMPAGEIEELLVASCPVPS